MKPIAFLAAWLFLTALIATDHSAMVTLTHPWVPPPWWESAGVGLLVAAPVVGGALGLFLLGRMSR